MSWSDGAPGGYAWYGRTEATFRSIHFATASDDAQRDAASLRNPDPCGDAVSLAQLTILGNLLTRSIDVPVLLLYGGRDVLNRPDAASYCTVYARTRASRCTPIRTPAVPNRDMTG